MSSLINIGLILLAALCLYIAYVSNLYQCALLTGRCFFAFIFALTFSGHAAHSFQKSLSFPPPYIEAGFYLAIWIVTMVIFGTLIRSAVQEDGKKMKFQEPLSIAGRLALGLFSAILVSGALGMNAVMVPAIEGDFLRNDSEVAVQVHRKALSVYVAAANVFSSDELTVDDVLGRRQMRAGAHWAKQQMNPLIGSGNIDGADALLNRLYRRYPSFEGSAEEKEIVAYFGAQGPRSRPAPPPEEEAD